MLATTRAPEGEMIKSPSSRFHQISASRAFEEVIDQITFAIRAGTYRIGDRLPTIEDLARMTGTSKPTVVGAAKVLAGGGVLRAQRGASGGLIVVSDNVPVALMARASGWRKAIITELLEARRPVEMELALLAGQRAKPDDLQIMRSAVDQLEQARHGSDRKRWLHLDHLFHYSLGRAARSELLAYYQHQILEQLAVHLREYYEKHEDPDWVLETHFETLRAVESRDPGRVKSAMDRHLMGLEKEAAVRLLGRRTRAKSSGSARRPVRIG